MGNGSCHDGLPRLRGRRQERPSPVKSTKCIAMARMKKYRTVLRVGGVVLWVRLSLIRHSLPAILQQLHHRSATRDRDDATMKALVGYVDRWLQLFPYNKRGNCFPRSLVLYRLARQLGYPVVFHCGVRKGAASLDGHAWLTLGSNAFYEPGTHWQRFTVTFSYPPHPTRGLN
jgi:hypothetical protein